MHALTTFAETELALELFLPSRLTRPVYTTEFVARFLESAGNPQNIPKAVHIAGTSGKTSTAYYVAALLQQTGKKIGLLTSPHLEHLNERVQINLEPLPEREFCQELSQFLDLVEQSGINLSHAEILYAFGYWEFARKQVDYIVIEVGMGGTFDATNVITREDKVCVITDIGLDHTTTLGDTLAEITTHKAGIIQPHNQVICHTQSDDVLDVIRRTATERHAKLRVLSAQEQDISTIDVDLTFLPPFQRRNFTLALAAAATALHGSDKKLDTQQMTAAAHTLIPGRMELLSQSDGHTIILDGAHNAQKMQVLATAWRAMFADQKTTVLVAFTDSRGRDLAPMLAELIPIASRIIATTLPADSLHSGRSVEEIAAACQALGIPCAMQANPKKALQELYKSRDQNLLITGSLYLLGYIRPIIRTIKSL